ncbi:hypothetical protein CBP52_12495 [Cellulomonas sp. PSBB021]|nr:hypothetical protein CBP52_12495 [Cellulomonas sp. PSBB021]
MARAAVGEHRTIPPPGDRRPGAAPRTVMDICPICPSVGRVDPLLTPPQDAPHPPTLDELLRRADTAARAGHWTAAARAWLEAGGRHGADVSAGLEHAASHLDDRADAGDAAAAGVLALMVAEFIGDLPAAADYARVAAEGGDPLGQRIWGFLLCEGQGVERDEDAGTRWTRRAADQGDPIALLNLAGSVPQREGDMLLALAAGLGVERAGARLGDRLSERDQDEAALRWYVWAAERGHAGSMRAAADWYREGFGGRPDPTSAVRWYLTLLAHGDGDGVHEAIGVVREHGLSDGDVRAAAALAGRPSAADSLLSAVRRAG